MYAFYHNKFNSNGILEEVHACTATFKTKSELIDFLDSCGFTAAEPGRYPSIFTHKCIDGMRINVCILNLRNEVERRQYEMMLSGQHSLCQK